MAAPHRITDVTSAMTHPLFGWGAPLEPRGVKGMAGFTWFMMLEMGYPLVMTNSLLWKMVIEIVDFAMENGDSPELAMFN